MANYMVTIIGAQKWNPELWSNFVVPEGLDKQNIINNILFECAELPLIYSAPDFLEEIIGVWSRARLAVWEKYYKTVSTEYSLNGKINKYVEWTDTASNSNNGTNTEQVQGFDSNSFVDRTKNSANNTAQGNAKHVENETRDNDKFLPQDYIEKERELAGFDMVKKIVTDFKREFCIMVF